MATITGAAPIVLVATIRDRTLAGALEAHGYAVAQFPTIQPALEFVRDTHPDIVIVEADQTGAAGTEVCAVFRRHPHVGRHVPILIVGRDKPTPDQRVNALRAGAWDFLRYPGDPGELTLKLEAYLQAKRNIDAALAEGMIDPLTGLHSRPGLARRARELGALMARHHGALACVVFAFDTTPADPRAGSLVANTARICDVVGALGPSEFAVLAPATDESGALKLAQRVATALCEAPGAGPQVHPSLRVGYDAVANLKYSPIDPAGLLARAASAVRTGRPEPGYPWVRRYDVNGGGVDEESRAVRNTPPGLVITNPGKGGL
jgi:PleD family two-component response regulator